jgi:hypothetical protein
MSIRYIKGHTNDTTVDFYDLHKADQEPEAEPEWPYNTHTEQYKQGHNKLRNLLTTETDDVQLRPDDSSTVPHNLKYLNDTATKRSKLTSSRGKAGYWLSEIEDSLDGRGGRRGHHSWGFVDPKSGAEVSRHIDPGKDSVSAAYSEVGNPFQNHGLGNAPYAPPHEFYSPEKQQQVQYVMDGMKVSTGERASLYTHLADNSPNPSVKDHFNRRADKFKDISAIYDKHSSKFKDWSGRVAANPNNIHVIDLHDEFDPSQTKPEGHDPVKVRQLLDNMGKQSSHIYDTAGKLAGQSTEEPSSLTPPKPPSF